MKCLLNRLKEEYSARDILIEVLKKCFNVSDWELYTFDATRDEIPHFYYEYSFTEKEVPFTVEKSKVKYDVTEFNEHLEDVYRISVQIGLIRRCLSTSGVREWDGTKWVKK